MTTLVFGHKSPDTDSTGSPIIWAWYLTETGTPAKPVLLGEPNTEAAFVLKRLPEPRRQGYFSTWPAILHSFADKVGQEPQMRRPRPSPRQITQAEEAMLWLRWLEPEDGRLVWARADGMAWKPICWQAPSTWTRLR